MKALIITVLAGALTLTSTAFAGGGGTGWTQCYVKDVGLSYSFDGYTQSLSVGKKIIVFSVTDAQKEYGYYQIDSINLSSKVGVIELSHSPSDDTNNKSKDTDFGNMKIEYFSNSALKDIKVTFSKDGHSSAGEALCTTD